MTQIDAPPHKRYVARNTAVLAVTAASAVAVFLYPTSLSSSFAAPAKPATAVIAPRASDLVVTGAPIKTEYGPVQVRLRLRAGKIIVADAIVYPKGYGLDDIINSKAIPKLDKEVLASQFAKIDTISGATYTSGGYLTSLQSALDMAHQS